MIKIFGIKIYFPLGNISLLRFFPCNPGATEKSAPKPEKLMHFGTSAHSHPLEMGKRN